jgi:hypothetical protein
MNTPSAARRSLAPFLLAAAVIALVAYYFWPRTAEAPAAAEPVTTAAPAPATGEPTLSAANGPLPPGAVSNVGGIPLDANGNRILNEAGLPISSEPVPQARPIPVKAPKGAIVGYTKDANGNAQPIRAGDLKAIPNSPGTFAVVDMWADGGPTVVPPTEGKRLSPAELAKLRAEEEASERAGRPSP